MDIQVKVTRKHINNGVRRTCSQCPVALAIAEKLNVLTPDVSVAQSRLYVFDKDCRVAMNTPDKVRRFIEKFDERQPVRGFTFELTTK